MGLFTNKSVCFVKWLRQVHAVHPDLITDYYFNTGFTWRVHINELFSKVSIHYKLFAVKKIQSHILPDTEYLVTFIHLFFV